MRIGCCNPKNNSKTLKYFKITIWKFDGIIITDILTCATQKIRFSDDDIFSKWDQIRGFLWIVHNSEAVSRRCSTKKVFSCEFCKTFKNIFRTEHLRATASYIYKGILNDELHFLCSAKMVFLGYNLTL